MPHKFNAARRHKFDKAQYRVIHWAEYNESLRQRGDLTIWVSEEAQSVWSAPRRTSRGGQRSSNASPDATAWERANSISAPIHATTLHWTRSTSQPVPAALPGRRSWATSTTRDATLLPGRHGARGASEPTLRLRPWLPTESPPRPRPPGLPARSRKAGFPDSA